MAIENLKKDQSISNSEISAEITNKPQISQNTKIFQQLPLSKKAAYFKDRYGTVRGTTGFFDYWFKQGIKDTKSFISSDGIIIDACIILGGGSYEGGGGDSTNHLIAYVGDRYYSSENIKYYECTYYVGGGKKENHNKSFDYQEIINCSYDVATDICTVVVKNAYGSNEELKLTGGKSFVYNESLLGQLYIPTGIGEKAEKISSIIEKTKIEQAAILQGEKQLSNTEMLTEVFNIYMEEGKCHQAKEVLSSGELLHTPETTNNLEKLFYKYLPNASQSGDSFSGAKDILYYITDEAQQKRLGIDFLENILAVGTYKNLKVFVEVIQKIKADQTSYHQRFFDTFLKDMRYYLNDDQDRGYLEELCGVNSDNYKVLYDNYVSQGGLFLRFFSGYTHESSIENMKQITQFFAKYHIDTISIFPEDYVPENFTYYHFEKLQKLVEDGLINKDLASKMIAPSVQSAGENVIKGHGFADGDKFFTSLKEEYNIPYGEQFFEFIITKVSSEKVEKYIKKLNETDVFYESLFHYACNNENTYVLDALYSLGYIKNHKDLVTLGGFYFEKGRIKSLEQLIQNENFTKEELALIIKSSYADEKVSNSDRYIPFVTHGKAISYIESILQYDDIRDYHRDSLSKLFARDDVSEEYVNNLLDEKFNTQNWKVLYTILQSAGLKINKLKVNGYISDCVEGGLIDEADSIAHYGGLHDLRGKNIAIVKIVKGHSKGYEIGKLIKKYALSEGYKKYVIEDYIKSKNIQGALEYCQENNITMTGSQIEEYRKAVQKSIEDAKQKEILYQEKLKAEALKRTELAKGFAQLIEEGKFDTDIDYHRDQKFIFFHNNNRICVASHLLEYHKNIATKVGAPEENIMGGGWIQMDTESKTITLYGSSGSYGAVPLEYQKLLVDIMSHSYPEYKIVSQ